MFEEMKFAVLLQRAFSRKPVITARQALRMATIDGAKALGLGHLIGSLEEGKRADLIAINLRAARACPTYDPISSLVFASVSDQVSFVMVNGEILMKNGKLLNIDEKRAISEMGKLEELVAGAICPI